MRFFIVKDENASYYYNQRLGILRKNLESLHSPTEIYTAGLDNFGLCTNNGTHIVCSNRNNDIIYIKYPSKPYMIIPGKSGIVPYNFTLIVYDNILNLFYLTDYKDKVLLYCCELGKSVHPVAIAELSPLSPHYYCEYDRIFYTNQENFLCCKLISDKFKNSFDKVCFNGISPCYTKISGNDFLVYKKDDTIYKNNLVVVKDKYAQDPIVFTKNEALYVQWVSENRIKYRRYENNKASDVIQCIGASTKPHIINIITNGHNNPCYGYNTRPSINF